MSGGPDRVAAAEVDSVGSRLEPLSPTSRMTGAIQRAGLVYGFDAFSRCNLVPDWAAYAAVAVEPLFLSQRQCDALVVTLLGDEVLRLAVCAAWTLAPRTPARVLVEQGDSAQHSAKAALAVLRANLADGDRRAGVRALLAGAL